LQAEDGADYQQDYTDESCVSCRHHDRVLLLSKYVPSLNPQVFQKKDFLPTIALICAWARISGRPSEYGFCPGNKGSSDLFGRHNGGLPRE
jgi:hypothetical protein